MNEFDALRREIEIRLIRETVYKAIVGLRGESAMYLLSAIEDNDKKIAWIGEFLKSKGVEWEKFYKEKVDGNKA